MIYINTHRHTTYTHTHTHTHTPIIQRIIYCIRIYNYLLKRIVKLLSRYPNANTARISYTIKLVLLAIYLKFMTTSSAIKHIFVILQTLIVKVRQHTKYISNLLEIISYYPKQFQTCMQIVNFKRITGYFGYLFQL